MIWRNVLVTLLVLGALPSAAVAQTEISPEHALVLRANGGGTASGSGLMEFTAGWQFAMSEVISFELRAGGGLVGLLHETTGDRVDQGLFRAGASLSFRYRIGEGPVRLGWFLEPGAALTPASAFLVPQFGIELEVGDHLEVFDGSSGGFLVQAWAAPWFPLAAQAEAPVFFGLGVGGFLGGGTRVIVPPNVELRDHLRDLVATSLSDVVPARTAPTAQCRALFREEWGPVPVGRCETLEAPIPAGQCALWISVASDDEDIDLRVTRASDETTPLSYDYATDSWPVVMACNSGDAPMPVRLRGRHDGSDGAQAFVARYPAQLPYEGRTLPPACGSEGSNGSCCLAHLSADVAAPLDVPLTRLQVVSPGYVPPRSLTAGPPGSLSRVALRRDTAEASTPSPRWVGRLLPRGEAASESNAVQVRASFVGSPALLCSRPAPAQSTQAEPERTLDGLREELRGRIGDAPISECRDTLSGDWAALEGSCTSLVDSLPARACVEWVGLAESGADIDLRTWHSADTYDAASARAEDIAGDNWPIVRLCNTTDATVEVHVEGRVYGAASAEARLLLGQTAGSTPASAQPDTRSEGGF
ncbi:MAG: hypothetical protein RLO52_20175 [Sandaracinaceae bacterium]